MRAIHCTKYGGPEVLVPIDIPKPIPQEEDALVKIYAAAVTNSDIFIRTSKVAPHVLIPFRLIMGIRKPRPKVVGIVYSGVIESVGKALQRYKSGDEVYGMTGFSLGTYGEYTLLKEYDSKKYGCMAIKPKSITHEEATAACYGGLLGFQALEKYPLQKGHHVLIYGAASTSGTIAIQYAKHLGATVTAVCRPKNKELVMNLGADKHLDYTNAESENQLEYYDLFVDTVGKARSSDLRKKAEKRLTDKGHGISIDDGPLLLDSERLSRVTSLIDQGIVKPILDRSYPFEQIREAHTYVEKGHKAGGVAITISHTE